MPTRSNIPTPERALRLARRLGVVRSKDLVREGVTRTALQRLVKCGKLERARRGLYVLAGADLGERRTLAEASRRVPHGVVCLLSALQFHGFTTQTAREVWMAIGPKVWRPKNADLPLRFVYMSGLSFETGIQTHKVYGVPVRVYSPAKTIVDCFKYRNKVGLDVAMEALRDAWRHRRCTINELWKWAKVCRVANVMRPYMEMLVA
ncbi:MAG: AbiEi antitoxin N-terminal domain-containing protein [Candidatus Methylomirabilales bacterium]